MPIVRALAFVALLTLVGPALLRAPDPAAGQRAGQPNIVLILTDDLDGRSLAELPNVQRLLAAQGTTFPNFFVTSPNCCPSRSTILRGQYAHNHGVLRNSGPEGGFSTFRDLMRERSTIGVWLQAAGYRTALMGKYLNGYPRSAGDDYVPPGWDEWRVSNQNGYFDYEMVENGKVRRYGNRPGDYLTDVLSAKANAFVAKSAREGRPFFLYLAPRAPHGPATPAPRHAGAFAGAQAPRTPAWNEADVSDKPAFVRASPPLSDRAIARIDGLYQIRRESMLAVDELVASLVDALDRSGQLANTYIVFTSDNGYQLGEHRLPSRKGTPYDEAIRIPLVVRGPGVPAGATNDALILNNDLAPTFADIAGVPIPDFVDGRSVLPLFQGGRGGRQAVLIEDFGGEGSIEKYEIDPGGALGNGVPPFRALRSHEMLYVEYASGERELYDRRADPYELENIANRVAPDRLKLLSRRLRALSDCARATCRRLENQPLPNYGGLTRDAVDVGPADAAGRVVLASADASVGPGGADGSAPTLVVDGGDNPSQAVLRFDVPARKRPVGHVTLRLFVADEPDAGARRAPGVWRASDADWDEASLTRRSRPNAGGRRFDTHDRPERGTWLSYDLTKVVTGPGAYAFVVQTDKRDGVLLAARESDHAPRLVVATTERAFVEGREKQKQKGDRPAERRPKRSSERQRNR